MEFIKDYTAKIVFGDGTQYFGYSFGAPLDTPHICEIVFNTSMVGYQEIVSDPSYTYQAVTMTYPIIGNYGIADDDFETKTPTIGALITRDYNDLPSNFRCTFTLDEILSQYDIPGMYGVDTRKIARVIRNDGSQQVCICKADFSVDEAVRLINETPLKHDAVSKVCCKKPWVKKSAVRKKYNVVAIDCGIKLNIVRSLSARGCEVTVVPYNTSAEEILSYNPDGVFISNGPGDPQDVEDTIKAVRTLIGKVPVCGICLGHQIISLAYGAKTYKLKFGHRGGNHPVKNLLTDKIEITSQNHSYAVDVDSLKNTPLEITHINLLDNTVEGVRCVKDNVFSVQYHPESAPGPQDSGYLFDNFIKMMEGAKSNA